MSTKFTIESKKKITRIIQKIDQNQILSISEKWFYNLMLEELTKSFKYFKSIKILKWLNKNPEIYPVLAQEILRIKNISKTKFYQI